MKKAAVVAQIGQTGGQVTKQADELAKYFSIRIDRHMGNVGRYV